MKTHSLIVILALVFCPFCLSAEEVKPVLDQLASSLQSILGQLNPKAEMSESNNGTNLVISYLPQSYKIHGRSMTGEISETTRDEIGPSFKGFVLEVYLQRKGEVDQLARPQTLREPYWQTDVNVKPLNGTQNQIAWNLSYGSGADTKLLSQIRGILGKFQPICAMKSNPPKAETIGEILCDESDFGMLGYENHVLTKIELSQFLSKGRFVTILDARLNEITEREESGATGRLVVYCSGVFATNDGRVFKFRRQNKQALQIQGVDGGGWFIIEAEHAASSDGDKSSN